ncbi:MAG: hypothetical protein II153_00715 [Erysipelotrichaceae bacterium]|nr:AbrB/MazE/SpoVT family DNA-binding domain-containing protein [Bacillota bacterium]MBQ1899403.1 hypothetical protein [Erysipelotrichaceae bacterium]
MEIAKLFEYEGSQAVQLPQNCHFVGDEVYVNRVGEAVMLIPKDLKWNTLIDSLSLFSDDFLEERDDWTK